MYISNPYYNEALLKYDKKVKARIRLNDRTLINKNIKNIKYDLNINDSDKFTVGGVYGATVTLILLNYDNEFKDVKLENKEFPIDLSIAMEDLYTVEKFNRELVGIINALKIKHISSLWIPQGIFYSTEITKNENKTITIKLIDKTKFLDDIYVCNLKPPFTLKQLYDDVHKQFQIVSDTITFYNQDTVVETIPKGYTGKQILGYIAECACGFYIVNRLGNGEIRTYGTESVKTIEKGKYKKFSPAENYITIQKIKYLGSNIIGAEKGYVLELEEKNPFITENVAQRILLKMQGFTFIPYTYQAINADFAIDAGDKIDVTDTNELKYLTYVMSNSWEFNGALSQNWQAKGENELNNTYSSKGPINQQIENIVKEQIPNAKDEAIQKATELITRFNGGYVVKKDGELFISDNEDIDKAQHIWRWNINGLGYSSTGVNGPYGLAMTMDGKIVADFITTGTMSAERINGGTLKLGGNNNTNGSIQVVDANGNDLVNISKDGLILNNGTKLIGNGGVLSNLQFNASGLSEIYGDKKSAGEYYMLGFIPAYVAAADKYNLFIDVYIPNDFTITSAYITLRHIPYSIGMTDGSNVYGYARNVKISLASMNESAYVLGQEKSEYYPQLNGISYSEILDCFDNSSNSFTASIAKLDNLKITQMITKDIGGKIQKKCRIKISTTDSIPSKSSDCFARTGWVYAQLNVFGYIK